MGTGPTNSALPTTSTVIGGVRNITTPTPADKQACALQVDTNGSLIVTTVSGTGVGGINLTQIGGNTVGALNGTLPVAVGISDSVAQAGVATAPTAGTAIVAAFDPTGGVGAEYEIRVTVGTGVAAAAADVGNMQLNKSGSAYVRLANPANGSVTLGPFRTFIPATNTLSVTAIANATAAVVYTATIIVTRVD